MLKTVNQPVKDPLAQALGRRGGKARMRTMTAKQRSVQARKAALARWKTA